MRGFSSLHEKIIYCGSLHGQGFNIIFNLKTNRKNFATTDLRRFTLRIQIQGIFGRARQREKRDSLILKNYIQTVYV